MLSYIWVSSRYPINGAVRYWISGMVAQRCGQTFPRFRRTTARESVASRLFIIGAPGGSVTLEKARVIHYRANVEANG